MRLVIAILIWIVAAVAAMLGLPIDKALPGVVVAPDVPRESTLRDLRRLERVVESPVSRAWVERRRAEIEGRR